MKHYIVWVKNTLMQDVILAATIAEAKAIYASLNGLPTAALAARSL